ncbi:MAG: hypothetical protein ABEJ72_06825, partial [Candidatus Aenigmatarchaeota archaeon]
MASKGIGVGSWAVILAGVVIGVTSIGISIGLMYSLSGGASAEGDVEALHKLGERTQSKCDAMLEGTNTEPLVIERIEFRQLENLKVQKPGEKGSTFRAFFPGREPASYKIAGCKVSMEPKSIGTGTWNITVSAQNGSE